MCNLHFKKFNKDVHCIDEDFDKYVQVKLCLARLLSEDWTVCAGAVKMRSDGHAPGGVADDEDDHNQQQDGRVVPVPGAALPPVDREEDADVEEDEKQQGHHTQEHQSVKRVNVIVDISIVRVRYCSCT